MPNRRLATAVSPASRDRSHATIPAQEAMQSTFQVFQPRTPSQLTQGTPTSNITPVAAASSPSYIAGTHVHQHRQGNLQDPFVITSTLNCPPYNPLMFPTANEHYPVIQDASQADLGVLHQAHLISPRPGPRILDDSAPVLYSFITGFAIKPTEVNLKSISTTLTFDVEEEHVQNIPKTIPPAESGAGYTRHLHDKALLFRIRCIGSTTGEQLNEQTWIAKTNSEFDWPSTLLMTLNGHDCELRTTPQYEVNYPVDVSNFIKPGINELKVACFTPPAKRSWSKYEFAIEIVRTASHSELVNGIKIVPTTNTLDKVKKVLKHSQSSNSDELAIVDSHCKIRLVDPMTGKPDIRVPVRSRHCAHLECFDLESFLKTRKRKYPGYPSEINHWQCPICRSDARPHHLFRNQFLANVIKEIRAMPVGSRHITAIRSRYQWRLEALCNGTSTKLRQEKANSDYRSDLRR